MSMENYPPDWAQRRKEVIKRDGRKCSNCGATRENAQLHAHHVRPLSEGGGNSLDNLITLCRDCHVDAHRENKSIDVLPVKWKECKLCKHEFMNRRSDYEKYCSKGCYLKHQRANFINVIDGSKGHCPVCFNEMDMQVCPTCGHMDGDKTDREGVDASKINIKKLLFHAIRWEHEGGHGENSIREFFDGHDEYSYERMFG